MEKEELKQQNYVKKFGKFVWEEMNFIQVAKAFAQWTQIGLLVLIYLLLREMAGK